MSRRRLLNQTGETIVEVLFAIAVLASALGGALAISTRSKNMIQANQERYQAQLIANGQADSLKIYMSNNSIFSITSTQYFCIDKSDTAKTDVYTDLSSPPDGCKQDNGANIGLYTVSIKQPSSIFNIFVINVSWVSIVNKTNDQVELVYGI
ncbi:MAG TPA: hypothetical protein VMR51_03000 [Patescibacteria group bacterium]|nr:hypothetical protein [Patescibacteria group bacterium]